MPKEPEPTIDPRYGRLLTPQEVEPSFTIPAFAANKFIVQPVEMGMRIAFGEEAPNTTTTYYRFAVTFSNRDAVQLYRVLKDALQAYENAVAAAEQPDEASRDG